MSYRASASPSRATALLALLLAASCQRATPESIKAWKTSPNGPEKLAASVKDSSSDPGLRAAAAAALVEAGYPERMEGVLAGLPLDDRAAVIPAMVPLLGKAAAAGDATGAGDALEALYAVRELCTTEAAKKSVDAVLFPALAADVRAGRERAGRYAVKDMLVGLGKDSIPTVLGLLDDAAAPFALPVEVLDKVGDADARAKGGAALVKRAAAAKPVPDPLWGAMATLGGKAVNDFLAAQVTGDPASAPRAAEAMAKLKRPVDLLPLALKLAGSAGLDPGVREQMFLVIEHVGNETARKGLIDLVGSTEDNALRARAFRAALTVGRGAAVLPLLEAVPRTAVYKPEEVRADLVAPIAAMPGLDSREGLFKALQSPRPMAKLVAILALEKQGFSSDAPHVAKLTDDKSMLRGFPRGWKLGREAARVVESLRKSKI
jgi:HEAT repeat protein